MTGRPFGRPPRRECPGWNPRRRSDGLCGSRSQGENGLGNRGATQSVAVIFVKLRLGKNGHNARPMMTTNDSNPTGTLETTDDAVVPPAVDEIKPTRWWALVALTTWLAMAVAWTAHIDRVTSAGGARSSIDWSFLVPCSLVAALVGAVQAGPRARWWGAILVVAMVLTIICMLATFFGTPRDWWQV